MLPKINQKISSFLIGEQGKISKESILKIGAFLTTTSVATTLFAQNVVAQHTNSLSISYSGDTATGTHAHHSSGVGGGGAGGGGCGPCGPCGGPCSY